jgi:uncharacterized protein YkwD
LLLVGALLAAAGPGTAAAAIVPPVPLPGVPSLTPPALPSPALPSHARGCLGAGALRAPSAVLRRTMLCLINHARANAGRAPLRAERHLARAAARHAADMGRRGYFAHFSPSDGSPLSRAHGAGWHGGVSEVIAWGCGSRSSPRATLRAWLHSPPHRSIVLGAGRVAGVGVKRIGGCGGRAYWVVDVG